MFLTKVELSGFKSFADRTGFDFQDGITAILGPNGCGKSNIVDAVKWVLGESSAKELRGSQMTDVIFNGTERRKPLGLAEVNLHFDNSAGRLPVGFNEVVVTRRLHRSGESEYLINRQPCLRRDIRDLFLDTGVGVGASAYSIIEQGRVEEILSAKPEERRAIFEEAAGIAKYKVRRKETLARLDRAQNYLSRVRDITEEVERSIRRVSRQAQNARRWQRLKGELEMLRTHHCARQHHDLTARLEAVQSQIREIDDLFARESAREAELSRELGLIAGRELDLDQAHATQEREALAAQEELGRVSGDLAAAAAHLQALEAGAQDAAGRESAAGARLHTLAAEIDRAAGEEADLVTAAGAAQEEAVLREQERAAGLAEVEAVERDLESLRRQAGALAERRSRLQADRARAEGDESHLRTRLAALDTRGGAIDAEEAGLTAALADAEGSAGALLAKVDELRAAFESARESERLRRAEAERFALEAATLRAERSSRSGRLSALQELEKSLAGAFEGVRAVLLAQRSGHAECAEVEGMVADLLTVPQEVAVAIETALGNAAQDLVVRTAAGAQRCIEHLKRERAGRATFLPLDRIRPRSRLDAALRGLPGTLGEALDLVRFEERHRAAMEQLLAGILVVRDLETARHLAGAEARGVRIVTLEGEVIHASGAMTGGHGRQQRAGLIQQKAELATLADEIARLDARHEEAEAGRATAIAAMQAAAEAARTAEGQLASSLQEAQRVERDLGLRRAAKDGLAAERGRLDAERTGIAQNLEAGQARRAELEAGLLGLDAEEQSARDHLAGLELTRQERRTRLDALTEALAGLRERRAEAQSRLDAARARGTALRADRTERETELAACREAIARCAEEREGLVARIETLRGSEGELLRRRDASREESLALRGRLDALRAETNALREEERAAQRRAQQAMQAQHELKLQQTDSAVRLDALVEKARTELHVEDLPARAAAWNAARADLAAAPEAPAPAGEEEGWTEGSLLRLADEALARAIEELYARIEKIGPVNLTAIEEQAELEARQAFLQGEQDDLQSAAQDLLAVIERLNQECGKKFSETFEIVRANFQDMFRRLFGGGKGDLVLQAAESGDPLDAGVEIIARPPGKEPTSISLLSGGEKALCAVALLLGILRSKPSPFVILDEVDGPLDESNIDRFMKAIRDFSKDTQFLLISHSKRTMGMTDTIYGVTQDEPGVSTRYSLKFKSDYEGKEGTPAAAAEPETVAAS